MRAWLIQSSVRTRRPVIDELRVLLGTAHGLWYGARLATGSAARRALLPGHRGRRADPSRLVRLARHPVTAVTRLSARLPLEHRLSTGRAARLRRLLWAGLGDQRHVLVLGHVGPVRQVWPQARLDVVGQAPEEAAVTVVSEARGPGSLPRRWNCVVLTDPRPDTERITAAVDACRPQGMVAFMGTTDALTALPLRAEVERVLTARGVRLVLARVLP
jgi:hypothetical protein